MEAYLHSFLNSTLDGDKWSPTRVICLNPEEKLRILTQYEAGLIPERVWTFRDEKNFLTLPRMESRLLCLVRPARSVVTVPAAISRFIEWEEGRNIKKDFKEIESKHIGFIAWHMTR